MKELKWFKLEDKIPLDAVFLQKTRIVTDQYAAGHEEYLYEVPIETREYIKRPPIRK